MAQSTPIAIAGHAYDPATIDLLRAVLEDTWAALTPEQQAAMPRSQIADRLLKAAADGERNPDVLRARALEDIAPAKSSDASAAPPTVIGATRA